MKRFLLLLLILSQSATANCWDKAAHYYHVDPGNGANLLI